MISLPFFLASLTCQGNKLKEGDLVFQMSKSKQSPLVQYATMSPWSHCGIIIEKNNKLYVLEASKKVKLTNLETWKKKGRFGLIKSRRIYNIPIKIKYKKYLGISYDLQFKFNNGKYYCSELIYDIYKEQFGKQLCKPKKIKEYNVLGLKKAMKQRNMSLEQLVVAPCDLL